MIYLDNAATTKPNTECLRKAENYLTNNFYNPSALYAEGYNLHRQLTAAREEIAKLISGGGDYGVIFTSCGTEADNQAIVCGGKRGNIVITAGEHSAVYASANSLKERGIEIRLAPLNTDGSVNVDELCDLVDQNTSLVSVIHVNNETGAINDVNAIARRVKAINPRVLFHSDGVQAFGKIYFKLGKEVDMYSVSAHKIGGIKGVGALILRKNLAIKPFINGGGQENGLRSGTENVFGIKTFEYAAVDKFAKIRENFSKVQALNSLMRSSLSSELFEIISPANGSPYILSVGVRGVRGETVLHEVNDKGLIIGTGSACSSNEKMRRSRVMTACGIAPDLLDGVLRLSFCSDNTEDEIVKAAEILNATVQNRKEIML